MNVKLQNNKHAAKPDFPLLCITGVMITLYVVSNIMAVKLVSVRGVCWFDAGTLTFPLVYMLGDVLTEHWGYKTTRKIIWLSFSCNALAVLCTTVGLWLPVPEYQADIAQAYSTLFGLMPRIIIASFVGFLAGELSNAWTLIWIRNKTGHRHLWMRTIGSSVVGFALDTGLFVVIAFAGRAPVIDLLSMFAVQFCFKMLVETLLSTPMAYVLLYFLRKLH